VRAHPLVGLCLGACWRGGPPDGVVALSGHSGACRPRTFGKTKAIVADQTWCIVAVCLSCAIAGVVLRSAVMGELVGGVQFLDHGGKFSEFSSLSSVLGRILLSTTLYL
jgi:hypothetical protein